jgi:hypothetical protein
MGLFGADQLRKMLVKGWLVDYNYTDFQQDHKRSVKIIFMFRVLFTFCLNKLNVNVNIGRSGAWKMLIHLRSLGVRESRF